MQSSGKLVILGILIVALASAAASWWFRYAATHRAAEFWGPQTARLIRDAQIVELYQLATPAKFSRSSSGAAGFLSGADASDVSAAPGLTHLRNALLEDRSYRWPPQPMQSDQRWRWALLFRNGAKDHTAMLLFSPDWEYVGSPKRNGILSCQPIADGLADMLGGLAPADQPSR